MKKVITYGTYDFLHEGHIRLLERAKKLGDYLIVAVTSDDFDKRRGKINVKQSLIERIEAVKRTGLADEIIIEEYEGQKIDDIINYGIDVFTVGSDWEGKFDYLKEYCEVVYLERTKGISSSQIRSEKRITRMGIVGNNNISLKCINESKYVNGLEVVSFYSKTDSFKENISDSNITFYNDFNEFLNSVDCVYIAVKANEHYEYVKDALIQNKHVLCESPICNNLDSCRELYELAESKNLILMEAIKTAFSTAFTRLILLAKTGVIGNIVSVDAICTSLEEKNINTMEQFLTKQNSITSWGPVALLPVFLLLGSEYNKLHFTSLFANEKSNFDLFTKMDFNYDNAVAQVKVGKGIKSEGTLIITGTDGYIYVPSPWWKTEYFELRYESQNETKRYFYQLDGEGIRFELLNFVKSIENKNGKSYIGKNMSYAIASVIEKFYKRENMDIIRNENL